MWTFFSNLGGDTVGSELKGYAKRGAPKFAAEYLRATIGSFF
jgi:hypothetical protein